MKSRGRRARRILLLAIVSAAALVAVVARMGKGRDPVQTPVEKAAFRADATFFDPMPKPGPSDWLAGPGRNEREQRFAEYVRSRPPGRSGVRQTIVLQPLGRFSPEQRELLDKVRRYAEIFFSAPSRAAAPVPLPTRGSRVRRHGAREWTQYLTTAIMDDVLQPRLPKDAICCLGVTMEDLYPQAEWNFVFGQAKLRARVGVYSFARYRPEFDGRKPGPGADELLLKRSVKVVVHEAGHMFGLHHCRRYECVLNGTNHLAESDARPVFLCPDCLRKLHWNLHFDLIERYQGMLAFWQENGFDEECAWLVRRLDVLRRADGTVKEKKSSDAHGGKNP